MISLARAGGASKDLLEWVTHGPPGDVIDGYTTLPWETLCQQVLCIKVERLEGKVLSGHPLDAVQAARAPWGVQDGHRFGHRCFETVGTAEGKEWGVQDSDL